MDTVSVTIPATPQRLHVVRLVAAGLAARLKFTLEDIEDLKIAVDELCAYLIGPHGRDGILQIRFMVHDDRIEISGAGEFSPEDKVRTELSDFSQMILGTVADSASLDRPDGVPTFSLTKSRRQ